MKISNSLSPILKLIQSTNSEDIYLHTLLDPVLSQKGFFTLSWRYWYLLFIHLVIFQIPSILKGLSSSYKSYSRISKIVWYSSVNFYSMRVIISELSMCTLRFLISPLSGLLLVIHSFGFLVTQSSLHL